MQTKIIILQSSNISKDIGQKCIARAKKCGIDIETSDGVHGADAKEILANLGLWQHKHKMKGGRLGVLGCFLSHYFLWQECVNTNEPYMIFEHDAYMLRPLPLNVLDLFPDILKLDSLDPYLSTYNQDIENQPREQRVWSLHERIEHGKHIHSGGLYSIGGYGYIIKPHAAQHLIDESKEHGFRPADHMLYTTEEIDIHHIAPSIVRIHPQYQEAEAMKSMSLTRNLEANSQR